jgi:Transcriptional regulators
MNRQGRMGAYRGRGLHGEVVEELGFRIVGGRLAEGQTLDVPELEAELDVSRTVLREALRVLKAKGPGRRAAEARHVRAAADRVATARPGRGPLAVPGRDDTQFLDDLAEVRGIIEPASARLAALRRTDGDIAGMEQALQLMSAAARGDGDAVEADLAFHRALLAPPTTSC